MEPVKGGALAALPEKAGRLLEKLSPDASQASYGSGLQKAFRRWRSSSAE